MRRGLGFHVALMAVLLLAGLAVAGTDGIVHADEGSMLAELEILDSTGEWTLPNPEPDVDPDMRALPFQLADRAAGDRWAPFAKHPVHIALLRPLYGAAGTGGVLVLSVAGVVLAAWCSAVIAGRLRPGTERVALWFTGIGSPLVFYSGQVIAHGLGAGCFGVAALLASRAQSRGWPAVGRVAGVAAAVAATALVRSEGVLAGLALGAAFGGIGLLRRRWWDVATGAAALVAAAAVRLGEPALVDEVLGGSSIGTVSFDETTGGDVGGLAGRLRALRLTVLDPGYGVDGGEPLLIVALLCGVAAVAVWRWRRDVALFRFLALAGALVGLARFVTSDFLVPGLLPALPLLALGIVSLGRGTLGEWPANALWATSALFAAAVAATQYEVGGSGEWGGRYFAIGIPVFVAVSVAAVAGITSDLDVRHRRLGLACVALVAVAQAVTAVRVAEGSRDGSLLRSESAFEAIDRFDVDATVATSQPLSRFGWEDVLAGRRWFTTGASELPDLTRRLASDGADRLALASHDPDDDLEAVDPAWRVETSVEVRGQTTVVLLTR